MGTHRCSLVVTVVLVAVATGGCAPPTTGIGGLSPGTAAPSPGGAPSLAPVPSSAVPTRTGATPGRSTHPTRPTTITTAPSPSSMPSRDITQDYSVGMNLDTGGHKQCFWSLHSGTDMFVGAKFYIGYFGPTRPASVSFSLTDSVNTHQTAGTAGLGAVSYDVSAPQRSTPYAVTLTMTVLPGFLDSDPLNDTVSVRVQVPAGSPATGPATALPCS
jgi:hypothetical protein